MRPPLYGEFQKFGKMRDYIANGKYDFRLTCGATVIKTPLPFIFACHGHPPESKFIAYLRERSPKECVTFRLPCLKANCKASKLIDLPFYEELPGTNCKLISRDPQLAFLLQRCSSAKTTTCPLQFLLQHALPSLPCRTRVNEKCQVRVQPLIYHSLYLDANAHPLILSRHRPRLHD